MPLAGRAKTAFLVTLALLLAPTLAAAQGRVGVRPTPRDGEVIHVTARQEVVLRIGGKPEEPGVDYLHNKNTVSFTQTNGKFNDDGKMDAQVTIEQLELDESIAGSPRPVDTTGVKGRILQLTFDRTGKLLGIKIPPDMRDVSSRLTQLLAGAYGITNFLPAVEIGIGEQTTHTSELPMRLPGNVSQGPLEARTTLTLRAVEKQDQSRVAKLQQDIEVSTGTTTIQMTGGGTIDVNLDRGFVSGTDTEWKILGTMQMKDAAQGPPFYGSIKINVTAN